jgi:hypothetical protein
VVTLAADLNLASSTTLTWVVYRSPQATGTFTLVSQQQSTSGAMNGKVVSGALDVALEAGRYYLLGVVVPKAHSYIESNGSVPAPLSFAQLLGGIDAFSASVPTELVIGAGVLDRGLWMSLETELP